MHILIVNSEYPPIGGGAGNASAHIARELVGRGHEVTVLTAGFAGLPREELENGLRIIRLAGLRRKLDRSTAPEQLLFMVVATFLGWPWVLKLKPQVVLAFFGAPSGVAAWVWSFFRRLPYIVSLRGGDVPGFRPYDFRVLHRLLGPLLGMVWRRASAVVANSRGLRKLAQAFEPQIPIHIIPNGVDLKTFHVGKRSWEPAHMLFTGRLVYQKGLDLLLNALNELRDIPWKLTLVGDGPQLEWLQEHAKTLKISERLFYAGWQDRESLVDYYRKANLFVYPSRHEGMPNALLEAMGSGLPAIATRISGNEELVVEGKTGQLVPTEDEGALKNALNKLLSDAELRKSMGAAARRRVEKTYTWESAADEYLRLLDAAVKPR